MDFRVEITSLAEDDIDEAAAYIARDSVRAASKWKAELEKLIFIFRNDARQVCGYSRSGRA